MQADQKRLELLQQFYTLQDNEIAFNSLALAIYDYQFTFNSLYRRYVETVGRSHIRPAHYTEITTLPIQFFKTTKVCTGDQWNEEQIFLSSGTGGEQSMHFIRDITFYVEHTKQLFESEIGRPDSYCFLALLPGYIERKGSSLIEMVNSFIEDSPFEESGFYLHNYEELTQAINQCKQQKIPTILFGVSFALLHLTEQLDLDLSHLIIIETGGMKGTRKEVTKAEVIDILTKKTGATSIYSEYGMTELLSQAYALDGIHFQMNKTLKLFTTELQDPFTRLDTNKSGQINIIDLANIDTCAFIQTQDLGRVSRGGNFEVLGRIDQSDLRGCNLLLEEIS